MIGRASSNTGVAGRGEDQGTAASRRAILGLPRKENKGRKNGEQEGSGTESVQMLSCVLKQIPPGRDRKGGSASIGLRFISKLSAESVLQMKSSQSLWSVSNLWIVTNPFLDRIRQNLAASSANDIDT